MKVFRRSWLILILYVLSVPYASTATIDIELAYFSKANHLASQGRYDQAAEQWHRLTIAFLSSEARLGQRDMWQYAGLSEALAAIAADKANKASAYQYWADSTRYLMTGGTNWELMRKKLHRRFEQANTQLSSQLQIADVVASVDTQWQQELSILQVWDEKLTMFSFTSPKLGLVKAVPYYELKSTVDASIHLQGSRTQGARQGKKLSGLKSDFSQEPQFVPTQEITENTNEHRSSDNKPPVIVPKSHPPSASQVTSEPVSGRNEPIVIMTGIEPLEFDESDISESLPSNALQSKTDQSETQSAEPEAVIGVLPRRNLDSVEMTGVKATQRRSFAPKSEE